MSNVNDPKLVQWLICLRLETEVHLEVFLHSQEFEPVLLVVGQDIYIELELESGPPSPLPFPLQG